MDVKQRHCIFFNIHDHRLFLMYIMCYLLFCISDFVVLRYVVQLTGSSRALHPHETVQHIVLCEIDSRMMLDDIEVRAFQQSLSSTSSSFVLSCRVDVVMRLVLLIPIPLLGVMRHPPVSQQLCICRVCFLFIISYC